MRIVNEDATLMVEYESKDIVYIIEYEGLSLLKASGNPVLTDSSTIDEMKRDIPMANEYEFCNVPKICNLKKFREKYSKTLINS